MTAKIAERPSLLQPSVASVAHSVSGTVTVIVPSLSRAAQPGPHLAMSLADERAVSEHAADLREQLGVGHRPDRPRPSANDGSGGLRGAVSTALLARCRPGDPRGPTDPGQREIQPS